MWWLHFYTIILQSWFHWYHPTRRCCSDVSRYVPKTLQWCLKWNTQQCLSGMLLGHLTGTSPWCHRGTSWRRLKHTSLGRHIGTSLRRPKPVSNETPNGLSYWYVAKTSHWYVSKMSQRNVVTSEGYVPRTTQWYIPKTSQTSVKWNTQCRVSSTLPRGLTGTRCLRGTSWRIVTET